MASLLVITGPPGAGKSTAARGAVAAAADHSVLVEGDDFFAFVANGRIDPWLSGSHEQNKIVTEAAAAAAAAAGRFALGGYTTVYDGVVGPWFLATFARATGLEFFEYVILLPSVERCVKQVSERTGHGFTDEAATRKSIQVGTHMSLASGARGGQFVRVTPCGPDRPESGFGAGEVRGGFGFGSPPVDASGEAFGGVGPCAFVHEPQPQLLPVSIDDIPETATVDSPGGEYRGPLFPEPVGEGCALLLPGVPVCRLVEHVSAQVVLERIRLGRRVHGFNAQTCACGGLRRAHQRVTR